MIANVKNWNPSLAACPAVLLALDMVTLFVVWAVFALAMDAGAAGMEPRIALFSLQIVSIVVLLYSVGGYFPQTIKDIESYERRHWAVLLIGAAVLSFILYHSSSNIGGSQNARDFLYVGVLFALASILYRKGAVITLVAPKKKKAFLVIGAGDLAKRLYLDWSESGLDHDIVVADTTGKMSGQRLCGEFSPVVAGDPIRFLEKVKQYKAIILSDERRGYHKELVEKLVECHMANVPIFSVEQFYEKYFQRIPYTIVRPHLLLRGGFQLAKSPVFENFKRLTDIFFSSLALIVFTPIFLILPVLIRMDSKGPVIFTQMRIGKNNVPIRVYKFRTMYHDNDNSDLYTRKNDRRITRVGRWSRLLHLDELPQLFNVLKGDMSLIGPRAEWNQLTQIYEKEIPFYKFRHLVKPGITGWAQVKYSYGENIRDTLRKFEYDLFYIRNYSLKLDTLIILKTFWRMTLGKGR